MFSSSSVYRRDPRVGQLSKRKYGHSPAVRAARRPSAVLVLRGAAAVINAGLHDRSKV